MTRTLLTELKLMPMTGEAAPLDGAVLIEGARILWAGAAADAPAADHVERLGGGWSRRH